MRVSKQDLGGKMSSEEIDRHTGFLPNPKDVDPSFVMALGLSLSAAGVADKHIGRDHIENYFGGRHYSGLDYINFEEEGEYMQDPQRTEELWRRVRLNPEQHIDTKKFADSSFMAGGGLALLFVEDANGKSNPLREKIKKYYKTNETAKIAGVPFTQNELELLGNYARFIGAKASLCMDERLETIGYDDQEAMPYVHKACGAIDAVATTFAVSVEEINELLREKRKAEQGGKEQGPDLPVYPDMPVHEVTKILVYLTSGRAISEKVKEELKQNQGLPFQISLSVEKIQQFVDKYGANRKDLIKALVKFGPGIALEIAKGHHNALHEIAAEATSIEVDDTPGADGAQFDSETVYEIMEELGKVTTNIHLFSEEKVVA